MSLLALAGRLEALHGMRHGSTASEVFETNVLLCSVLSYTAAYGATGNTLIALYGWSTNPLVEYVSTAIL